MTMTAFRSTAFRGESRKKIDLMVEIVADYAAQDLRLTARQLYYQFVSRNLIVNTERSYKNLTNLLTDARYAGLIDWDAIEDRGREPVIWREHANVSECVNSAIRSYRRQRWLEQPSYVELWVEKQALAGVLEPLASEFHVTLMVNKGYSSASAMYESAQRFRARQDGKELHLFYLGDHDPSGEDMVRDITERLAEFGADTINVEKIALTMAQVDEYNPPPNPAKTTDSRFAAYADRHGESSWEVDALPPNVLQSLVRGSLEGVLDVDQWEEVLRQEELDKKRLKQAAKKIDQG